VPRLQTEKGVAHFFRTERRRSPNGGTYPWIVRSTALVNQWHLYIKDADFGPFFLKFSSYFPYNAKLCLNGHEFLTPIAIGSPNQGCRSPSSSPAPVRECCDPAWLRLSLKNGLIAVTSAVPSITSSGRSTSSSLRPNSRLEILTHSQPISRD
jgi:hypothetical protein